MRRTTNPKKEIMKKKRKKYPFQISWDKIPTELVEGTSGKCDLHFLGVGYLENVTLHFFFGSFFGPRKCDITFSRSPPQNHGGPS